MYPSILVALNYQTPDRPMQLNQGWFMDNGGCGYVLKSEKLIKSSFHHWVISHTIHKEIWIYL